MFDNFVDRIYPIELEKKDTTYTDRSASYLELHLEIYSEDRLRTKPHGSVASLLAATLYQGNHDRNYKVWNIGSSGSEVRVTRSLVLYVYFKHILLFKKTKG
jgi:hypothetical protein